MAQSRRQLRLFVSLAAKKSIEGVAERDGMTELAVASRVYEWFSRQPEMFQRVILGHVPDDYRPDVIDLILKRMRDERRDPG